MNAYLKLTLGILLIAFAIIGSNFFIPHKLNSSVSTMKEVYFIVIILSEIRFRLFRSKTIDMRGYLRVISELKDWDDIPKASAKGQELMSKMPNGDKYW